ncbi:MAG: YbaK/prolyl-tRNA synthetase associated region [uncultured bacterium]|nr:MAG: YbaK/prolyl-tRNA synthetase associated region [uncultured bacterium]
MPILPKLQKFLEERKAKYDLLAHRKVYTTYDAAQTQKENLKRIAKTLFVKADSGYVFVVVPGDKRFDQVKLKKLINDARRKEAKEKGEKPKLVKKIKLTSESMIKKHVTKKVGALAPFGQLYKLATYYDKGLDRSKKILLNAGSFTESLEMTPAEYKRLEAPIVGRFSK